MRRPLPTAGAAWRWNSPGVLGLLCGLGAALSWAAGLVAARHGIVQGLTPADLAFHRYVWAGLLLLPAALGGGFGELRATGLRRSFALALVGGPAMAAISYTGFLLAPLGHGALAQPGTAALWGLFLASVVVHEPLAARRLGGALAIVAGLALLAAESAAAIGTHALLGDGLFALAGLLWGSFGIFVRLWDIPARRSAAVVCILSVLLYAPFHALVFGFSTMARAGWGENLLQVVVQAGFAGALAISLAARAAILLGAGRAAAFPAMVPALTVLIGLVALGEAPTAFQLLGLLVVAVGFRFALLP